MEPVGPYIRAQRKERDSTVRGLARASGVSACMISLPMREQAEACGVRKPERPC